MQKATYSDKIASGDHPPHFLRLRKVAFILENTRYATEEMEERKIIELKQIFKEFDGESVLKGIDLDIHDNEFMTLLGPSGCGKTTTLRIIGGFVTPDSGDVYFDGKKINNIPPHKRQLNTVFQKYSLFPHMNVYENVAFALRLAKTPEKIVASRVAEMLELVNLRGFEKKSVNYLSGGQQQRIAIARALIGNPRVLLLDEPLGALDLKLRKEMQTELKNLQKTTGITFIYVTHDQEEALTMSDTVVVMNGGLIQQIGSPQDIYNEPVNAFVADFIGESNIVSGIMHRDFLVEFAGNNFTCVDSGFAHFEPVNVVIRPEDIVVTAPTEDTINGVVKSVTFKGVHYEMIVDACSEQWKIHSTRACQAGDIIGMSISPEDIHIMHKYDEDDRIAPRVSAIDEESVSDTGI